jgi:uncharacterized protein (TIGR02391 family)
MDLQKEIAPELHTAIKVHYEAGLFSNAILDAMKVLTELIRSKSKLDGDGANLVGQAFGGNAPPIKISPMQKVSEIDEQRGFEQLLRGFYIGIRNPRTHENYTDKKKECNAIILFVNYLIDVINSARSFFVLDEFKKRIFDPLFVEKSEYAELLVAEIPQDELVNVTISILQDRNQGDAQKLGYFFDAIFNKAEIEQQQLIMKVFSNELKTAQSDSEIIGLIRFINPPLWSMIDEDTKLRIENRIIASVKEGYLIDGICKKGALGTWGNSLGQYFKLKQDLARALIDLLQPNWYTQNYVGEYYLAYPDTIVTGDRLIENCCENLAYATLGNNAKILKAGLSKYFSSLPKKWCELYIEKALRYKDKDEYYFNKLHKLKDVDLEPF